VPGFLLGWVFSFAGYFECQPALGVVLEGAFDGGGLVGFVLGVEVFEVGDAPAAAGAGAEAL